MTVIERINSLVRTGVINKNYNVIAVRPDRERKYLLTNDFCVFSCYCLSTEISFEIDHFKKVVTFQIR